MSDYIPKYPRDAYRTVGGRLVAWLIGAGEAAHMRRATHLLGLQPGDCVCDAACGSGYNIGTLVRAVGPQGQVIAVEDNPHLLALAERRVRRAGWQNVQLLPELDPAQFKRRPVDGIVAAFNAPIFLGRSDLVESAWSLLKPTGYIAVAGGRTAGPLGQAFKLLGPLMLRLAGHPQDWRYWDSPEPWHHLRELASGDLQAEITLGFWFLVWAEKPAGVS